MKDSGQNKKRRLPHAFVKLERLEIAHKANHFVLKSRLYINALKAVFKELENLNAQLA